MIGKIYKFISDAKKVVSNFSEYYLQIIFVFIVSSSSALMEGLGISALIPVFSLLQPEMSGNSKITEFFQRTFEYFNLPINITYILIGIVSLFLLKTILKVSADTLKSHLRFSYLKEKRDNLFKDLFNTKWQYFQSKNRGFVFDDLVTQSKHCSLIFKYYLEILVNIAIGSSYLIMCFFVSTPLTLLFLIVILAFSIFLFPLVYFSKKYGQQGMKSEKDFSDVIEQYLSGFKELKVSQSLSSISEAINSATTRFYKSRLSTLFLRSLSRNLKLLFGIIAVFIVFIIGIETQNKSVAEFSVVAILFVRGFRQCFDMKSIHELARRIPSLDSIDRLEKELSKNSRNINTLDKIDFEKQITLDSVSFSYKNDEEIILDSINFDIQKNEFIGVVGPSGAGKSTLVDLLLGLIKPTQGQILVDSQELTDDFVGDWWQKVAFVPQDSFLINDTIISNVRFHKTISKKIVVNSLKKANALEFIQDLPNGLDTNVGPGGIKLSGGQKQRICLARAISRKPELLILDEATSDLDSESENEIQDALETVQEDITLVAVAHRLSTIMSADNIIVLDSGNLIGKGSPKELLNKSGRFKELYEAQQMGH
jgi:ABC-type multidrug transport system fused ATPase/permease subunit